MRLRSCLRFGGMAVFLVVVGWLLTNGTWGACPNTEKYQCLCLQPATVVKCSDIKQPATCEANKEQTKTTNFWDCKSGNGKQCLNGTEQEPCYYEYDCEWITLQNKCQGDALSQVTHYATLKVNEDCTPQS